MKARARRPALLAPALLAPALLLGACRHFVPLEPPPPAPTAGAPATPTASIRPPELIAFPVAALSEPLPVPVAPELTVGGLRPVPGVSVAPPLRRAPEGLRLPVPVALAAPPRTDPSYAMIDRASSPRPGRERMLERPGAPGTLAAVAAASGAGQREAAPGGPPGGPPTGPPAKRATPPTGETRPTAAPPPATPPGPSGVSPAASPSAPPQAAAPARPGAESPRRSAPQEVREEYREVLARRGDPVELSFEGEGWLFTAVGRSAAAGGEAVDGLEFQGSSSEKGRTRFSFVARSLGEYRMSFQLQNHTAGILRNEVVRLRVLGDEEFSRELEGAAGGGFVVDPVHRSGRQPEQSAGTPGPAIPRADHWFELGEFELALREYLREYRPGDPYMNDRIAASYAATGEYLAATRYYTFNLGASGDYLERAVLGLVRCGLALEDERLLVDMTPALLGVETLPIRQELVGLARYHMDRERAPLAMTLLQEFQRRYPHGPGLDEVTYRLAQLYESETPLRDLAAAREAYRRVYDQWPESLFSEPSHARLRYLERHFFDVR